MNALHFIILLGVALVLIYTMLKTNKTVLARSYAPEGYILAPDTTTKACKDCFHYHDGEWSEPYCRKLRGKPDSLRSPGFSLFGSCGPEGKYFSRQEYRHVISHEKDGPVIIRIPGHVVDGVFQFFAEGGWTVKPFKNSGAEAIAVPSSVAFNTRQEAEDQLCRMYSTKRNF